MRALLALSSKSEKETLARVFLSLTLVANLLLLALEFAIKSKKRVKQTELIKARDEVWNWGSCCSRFLPLCYCLFAVNFCNVCWRAQLYSTSIWLTWSRARCTFLNSWSPKRRYYSFLFFFMFFVGPTLTNTIDSFTLNWTAQNCVKWCAPNKQTNDQSKSSSRSPNRWFCSSINPSFRLMPKWILTFSPSVEFGAYRAVYLCRCCSEWL